VFRNKKTRAEAWLYLWRAPEDVREAILALCDRQQARYDELVGFGPEVIPPLVTAAAFTNMALVIPVVSVVRSLGREAIEPLFALRSQYRDVEFAAHSFHAALKDANLGLSDEGCWMQARLAVRNVQRMVEECIGALPAQGSG
jgi:hypothetical protein